MVCCVVGATQARRGNKTDYEHQNVENPQQNNEVDSLDYTANHHSPLRLRECLEVGISNNYSLQIVRNREAASHADVSKANAGALPTVNFTADYDFDLENNWSKLREPDQTVYYGSSRDQDIDIGLSVAWTLFDGFKIQAAYERLQELETQSVLATRIAIEDYIASVTAEYYNSIHQGNMLRNLQYAVDLSRERLRIVESRYHVGSFSRLDYQQAKVDFNVDSANLIKQQEAVFTSKITLNKLMASGDVDAPLMIPDTVVELNTKLNYERLLRSTLESNSEILDAAQETSLAKLDYKTVLARKYPYVVLSAGYGFDQYRYNPGTTKYSSQFGLNAGITVGINIFDGTRRRQRANAAMEIKNAELEQENVELGLRSQLSDLWQSYLNNLSLLSLERSSLVSAKDNYEIAMDRYMLGDLSGIEMREAQKSLLDAEERILQATFDIKLCEISLMLISGDITIYLD